MAAGLDQQLHNQQQLNDEKLLLDFKEKILNENNNVFIMDQQGLSKTKTQTRPQKKKSRQVGIQKHPTDTIE